MPTYDYRCGVNGRVLEVRHRMSEQLNTWGDLCRQAGVEIGDTPAETPVERLATGGHPISSISRGSNTPAPPPCASGGCCQGGVCSMH